MAAPAASAVPQLNFGPEVTYILAAVLIITGLALAFKGHGLWSTVMSMIGALLGSAVGFLFGAALGGMVAGLVLALVGAVIGSILFTKLVKVALAVGARSFVQFVLRPYSIDQPAARTCYNENRQRDGDSSLREFH